MARKRLARYGDGHLTRSATMSIPLTQSLLRARRERRLSQLALALKLDVSQRHLSFVESGRALPSRGLLLRWLAELELPLGARNAALIAAGYAPAFGDGPLTAVDLKPALNAIRALIDAPRQAPALVLDSAWTIHMMNAPMRRLAALLMPERIDALLKSTEPLSMLDLMADPDGWLKRLINPAEVAPTARAHLAQISQQHPLLRTRVDRALAAFDGLTSASGPTLYPPPPLLNSRFSTSVGELKLFSVFSTFGTPQHITLASLRIEHLFAADEATARVLAAFDP
jgi:transcriptional regulator with XRE-family HTH domain